MTFPFVDDTDTITPRPAQGLPGLRQAVAIHSPTWCSESPFLIVLMTRHPDEHRSGHGCELRRWASVPRVSATARTARSTHTPALRASKKRNPGGSKENASW